MQRATQRARVEFENLILQHTTKPLTVKMSRYDFATKLMRYGATLGRIAENQCNGYQTWDYKWDEKAAKRDELKEALIQVKVTKLCALFNCKPVFQGDPRGNTLKIQVPDGYTNDWGREGICVPTS